MYGQMTAGSWIYIGTQGIVQGTYECFAEIARRRFDGSLAGTITLTAGLGGMGGAQPLAITMNGGVALCVEVDPSAPGGGDRDRLPRRGGGRPRRTRSPAAWRPRASAAPLSVGLVANAADALPELPAHGLRGGHRHRPDERPRPAERLRAQPDDAGGGRCGCEPRTPTSTSAAPAPRSPPTARRWSASSTPAPRSSTTATACAPRRSWAGSSGPSPTPASSPPTSARCSARARARSAGSRSPATRRTSPRPTARCSRRSPTTSRCGAGSDWPRSGSPTRACRPGSAGPATASGHGSACASTSWCDPARSRRRS